MTKKTLNIKKDEHSEMIRAGELMDGITLASQDVLAPYEQII